MRAGVSRFRVLAFGALAVSLAACGGGGGSSESSSAGLAFIFQHNARFNDGRTVRFAALPIPVFTNNIAQQGEVTEWTGASEGRVTFAFVGSKPARGISFRFGGGGDEDICGLTTVEFEETGEITSADVQVVRAVFRTAACVRTVTHEVGHALGFLDHTSDGGLMDDDGGNGQITPPVARFMRDLYGLAPGTVVAGERTRPALRRSGSRYVITIVDPVRR